MTARILLTVTVSALFLVQSAAGQATAPASAPSPAPSPTLGDRLAAASLLHSAEELQMLADAPARARRLVSHLRFAQALVPDHPLVHCALANVVYAGRQQTTLAAEAVGVYLKSYRQDYRRGLSWLNWSLAQQQTARARLTWLDSVVARTDLSAELRAEAAALKTDILLGQGNADKAIAATGQALELDGGNVRALTARLSIAPAPQGAQRIAVLLDLAEATAGSPDVTLELASALQAMGLHTEALVFHQHLWEMTKRGRVKPQTMHAAVVRYANALMDAGQAQLAVDICEPLLESFPDSVDLRSLLVEALDTTSQADKAVIQRVEIGKIYRPMVGARKISADQARQLAVFFTLTQPDGARALRYANQAALDGQADELTQRIIGAAELKSDDKVVVQSGVEKLEKLVDKDTYAAAMLAEHYAAAGNKTDTRRVVLRGVEISREGPAYRKLAAVAKAQQIEITPIAGSDEAGKAVADFDKRTVTMSAEPEKYVSVTVTPVVASVAVGEPIEVTVTLRNISTIKVPLGAEGLMRASVAVKVSVKQLEKQYTDYPATVLPAPRYLMPGQSISRSVRLDVGPLARELALRPLDKLDLTITAIVAPYQYGNSVFSAVERVQVPAVSITRRDMLGDFDRSDESKWRQQYQHMLGVIVRDMKRGRLATRIRSAHQVGALLALARQIETGSAKPPIELHGSVTKPVLLTMLREVLKDRSDVVRAEMLVALRHVLFDRDIMVQVAAVVDDSSALVRYRFVELVAASRLTGGDTLTRHFSKDRSELVRSMASAFTQSAAEDK